MGDVVEASTADRGAGGCCSVPVVSGAAPAAGGFVRPQTAQQAVLDELRRMITSGEMAPGAVARQEELAERFGLSRVPIREALKILEGEGRVSYVVHRGYSVTQLSVSDLVEVYNLREWLEAGLVRASVPLLTPGHEVAMRRAMARMADAAGSQDMVLLNEQNRAFHFQLFTPSGLHRGVRMVRQLWDTTDPYRSLYYQSRMSRRTVNVEHEQILAAAMAGDADETVRLLDVHRGHSVVQLQESLAGSR